MTSLTESFIVLNILHCAKMNKMRKKYGKGDYSLFNEELYLKRKLKEELEKSQP